MTVIVTGFAGTVGDAFTRYFLESGHDVIGVDNNEWAVASYPDHPKLTKILDEFYVIASRLSTKARNNVDMVVHCAAYKHVDLIEANHASARKNNVDHTQELYNRFPRAHVIFISTDKAVNPVSFYGETKQEGENMTLKHERGIVFRFGNIYDSHGSVIPRWYKAVANKEPLPVTDMNMKRWVITADEAVKKCMEAAESSFHGMIVIPNMGQPLTLRQMVADFLFKAGLPLDYPTKVIGIRPGERLEERLFGDDEEIIEENENVYIVRRR